MSTGRVCSLRAEYDAFASADRPRALLLRGHRCEKMPGPAPVRREPAAGAVVPKARRVFRRSPAVGLRCGGLEWRRAARLGAGRDRAGVREDEQA
jgi:hypothetical protein